MKTLLIPALLAGMVACMSLTGCVAYAPAPVEVTIGWHGDRYWDGHRYWERHEWEAQHSDRRDDRSGDRHDDHRDDRYDQRPQ